jgi:hypothetical protein
MTYLAGAVALLSGGCFLVLGAIAGWELLRERGRRGFSQFGASLCATLLICGAFHLAYAAYCVRGGGTFSLPAGAATLLGTAPVAAFTLLRLELLRGGRGDRFVDGTPTWLHVAPWVLVFVAGMLAAGSIHAALARGTELWGVWPALLLMLNLAAVGWLMARAQARRRESSGGWSLAGVTLATTFAASAVVQAAMAADGGPGVVLFTIDLAGVPATTWFLLSTGRLYRSSLHDWNRRPLVGRPRPTRRPSPWASRA